MTTNIPEVSNKYISHHEEKNKGKNREKINSGMKITKKGYKTVIDINTESHLNRKNSKKRTCKKSGLEYV